MNISCYLTFKESVRCASNRVHSSDNTHTSQGTELGVQRVKLLVILRFVRVGGARGSHETAYICTPLKTSRSGELGGVAPCPRLLLMDVHTYQYPYITSIRAPKGLSMVSIRIIPCLRTLKLVKFTLWCHESIIAPHSLTSI
jgi:hypothetical protein